MLAVPTFFFALGACLSFIPTTLAVGQVQKPGLVVPAQYSSQKDVVKEMFSESYSFYKKYAFEQDDVLPVSKGSSNSRNGWGATIIDAMDTMKLMGFDDFFNEALGFVSTIDFSKSRTGDTVSVFESTIRYVGGLLSAYELSGRQHSVLLEKAQQLADKLAFAWVGQNDVPFGYMDFTNNQPQQATSNIAEAGTLTLEWATLSKYTGNSTYRLLAEKSAKKISGNPKPLPGLPAQGINPQNGSPVGGYVTWGGGSDSYFEYLIKYQRLSNTADQVYVQSWETAVDSSIQTLLRTSVPGDWKYLADYDNEKMIRHVGSHLECFHGGNWLLGGSLLKNQTIIDVGLALVDSCWNTYASTTTGIGPEVFAYISSDGGYTGGAAPTSQDLTFYLDHGFYITAPDYVLRPEVLESNFYAWRVTGDVKYLDRAEAAIESFKKHLRVDEGGYAGIYDVRVNLSEKVDDTESFWYAEVMKYLYLTFDEPSTVSLDEYVFNTEAHPFKAPPASDIPDWTGPTAITAHVPFTPTVGQLPKVSPIQGLSLNF